jgi:flagellar biogenesis protein FliO
MRVALPLLLVASTASADVGFQVVDHGDSVEVIAHGLTMKNASVSPIRSRLEVPLTGAPIANRQMMQDATVMQVELDGYTLSVKTKLDRPEVHELAKLAKATQVGDDVHLTFPRHAAVTVAAAPAPAPAPAAPAPVAAPVKPVAAAPTTPTPAPAPVAAAPTPTPPPTLTPKKTPIPAEQSRDWNSTGFYAIAAFAALGAAAYLMKKKQKAAAPVASIDVIAQRALGGKAKVVWLAAGQREMIVAVSGAQVRMLGQWPRSQTQTNAPMAELPMATVETAHEKPVSPSVAGILKLRAATHGRAPTHPQIPIDNDEADVEPDMAWAKEIIAATGRK